MVKYLLFSFFSLITFSVYGQDTKESLLRRELVLTVDNDALLIASDKYYSSGIYAKYRRLIDEDHKFYKFFDKKGKLSKAIVSYDFEHRMYTPEDIDEVREEKIDRPYAGWVNLKAGLNYHFINNSVLIIEYDLGWLGPATRTGDIQRWWHDFFNMKQPNGWDYQINNTIATNLSIKYQKRLIKGGKEFDVIGEQFVQLGTIRNNIRTGLTMRLGGINDLNNSIYTYSKMGQERKRARDIPQPERVQEIYFYVNATMERVIYNTTIEGNLIGTPSPFTKEAEPWVFHHEYGLARSGRLFDFRIAAAFRGREIKDNLKHGYVSITLVQRF